MLNDDRLLTHDIAADNLDKAHRRFYYLSMEDWKIGFAADADKPLPLK
jgi:hypothetical protein